MSFDRRRFLQGSLLGAAAAATSPFYGVLEDADASPTDRAKSAKRAPQEGLVIDTNVHLFRWPFRALKYAGAEAMVAKLRQHAVREAWTGSYEALFHKNIDYVNSRLAEVCHEEGEGLLVPFGTVRPGWPDWEEDLRRADEVYEMPGIRLYPGYQNYDLELPQFRELLQGAAERGLIVQIVIDQEDERMQHPRVEIPAVDVGPLPEALAAAPGVKMQLINPFRHVRGDALSLMVEETDVVFGISNLDGTGAIERIMNGTHPYGATIAAERLLVGSHVPFRPLENVLFKFMESEMSEAEAEAIMAGNAEHLLERV